MLRGYVPSLLAALLLLTVSSCGQGDDLNLPRTAVPAATDDSTSAPSSPTVDVAAPQVSPSDFCEQAELTIIRWDLPPALSDTTQTGTIELRYRVPPGAEALVVWMGVTIDVGGVTFGDVLRVDPGAATLYPNVDPAGPIPATVPSHGFDLEFDGQTRTVQVPITLPSEDGFDTTEPWRWSRLSPPPFRVGRPFILATFRTEGVRLRLDGQHCTPIYPPLP